MDFPAFFKSKRLKRSNFKMGDKFHWTAKIAIKLKTFVKGQSVTYSANINRI